MEKIKNFFFSLFMVIGGMFVIFGLRRRDVSIKKETLDKSNDLANKSGNLYNDGKKLDEKAKMLDNVSIKEDEEWYKK